MRIRLVKHYGIWNKGKTFKAEYCAAWQDGKGEWVPECYVTEAGWEIPIEFAEEIK